MASEYPLKYFMTTRLPADEACQLTLSPVAGTEHLKGWAVPKDSPYADILNYWYRLASYTHGIVIQVLEHICPSIDICGKLGSELV
jgi:hypothetical protein